MTEHRVLRTLLTRRNRIKLIFWLAFAAVVAVVAWDLGLDAGHATLLGALITGAGILQLAMPELDVPELPELPSRGSDGVRQDVVTLSFALRGEKGVVRETAVLRVRDIARRRLVTHGLDLENPAHGERIAALLGTSAYRIVGPRPSLPSQRALGECLDALDRFEQPHSSTPNVMTTKEKSSR